MSENMHGDDSAPLPGGDSPRPYAAPISTMPATPVLSSQGGGVWKSSSSLLNPAFTKQTSEKEDGAGAPSGGRRRLRHRTVPLWVFASTLLTFMIVTMALGLGLGLGLGPSRSALGSSEPPPPPPPSPSPSSFDYGAYFGLPDTLDFVPIERLVNATELDLATDFGRGKGGLGSGSGSGSGPAPPAPAVRDYTFVLTQAAGAPDGVAKPMVLVNGQSPGPLVEANTGDRVRVRVVNRMAAGTAATIHWHGIDQRGSVWMDGVTCVTQCAVPAGREFVYDFVVEEQRGTFWWHAHTGVEYSDGAYGAIIIHDPEEMVPEVDEDKIVFLSDVYHTYGPILLDSYLNTTSRWVPFESGVEPLADNILINGQHTYDCAVSSTTWPEAAAAAAAAEEDSATTTNSPSGPSNQDQPKKRTEAGPPVPPCTGGRLHETRVRPGSAVRLRLINASSFLSYWFSVDGHELTVVELDGVEIEPIPAQRGVYINLGQRVSVILRADQQQQQQQQEPYLHGDSDDDGHGDLGLLGTERVAAAGAAAATRSPRGDVSYRMRATLPRSCFLPYAPYESSGLARSAGYEGVGLLTYAFGGDMKSSDGAGDSSMVSSSSSSPQKTIAGERGNVTNPWGADHNSARAPDDGTEWEGCDEMPFDLPTPMRRQPALADVHPDNMHYIEYAFRQAQNVNRVFVNKTSYAPIHGNATLWKALDSGAFAAGADNSYGSWGFGLDQQVLLVPQGDLGAQVVINSRDAMEHPWHLHGHAFQVVGWGRGRYGEDGATAWRLDNPMRRDTVTVPAFGHVVLRFRADNPGLWALHCHVAWHMEGGMLVQIAERPDDLARLVADMDPATRDASLGFCGT